MVRVPIGRGLTWACPTPEAAAVMRDVFAGRYAASPRARRRFVPWSARARHIRADAEEQPTLPGMAAFAQRAPTRRVPSYAVRTAKRRASVAARVGACQ